MQHLQKGCAKRVSMTIVLLIAVGGIVYNIYKHPLARDVCTTAIQQIGNDSASSVDYMSVQIPLNIQLQQITSNNIHQFIQIDLNFDMTEYSIQNIDILNQFRSFHQFRYDVEVPGGFTLATENPHTSQILVVINPKSVDIIGWPPAVHICDNNGNQIDSFRIPGSPLSVISAVSDVSVSHDGQSFAISNGESVYLMDANTHRLRQLLPERGDHVIYNNANNMLLIVQERLYGEGDSQIFIWDLINSEKITLFQGEVDFEPIGFINDDSLIAIMTEDETVMVWGVLE